LNTANRAASGHSRGRSYLTHQTGFDTLTKKGKQMSARPFTITAMSLLFVCSLSTMAPANAAGLAACKADAARLCPGITPGGGKLAGCLKEHQDEVSIGCGKAIQAMKGSMAK
jgi:hypothetical protein